MAELDLDALERQANRALLINELGHDTHEDQRNIIALVGRIRELERSSNDYCTEGKYCVCGGDLPSIREGCGNWRKGE